MEAANYRNVKPGNEFDIYFPRPKRSDPIVARNVGVMQTPVMCEKIILANLSETAAIAKILKGANRYETCRNVWNFVYDHIRYKIDQPDLEQIRNPARSWADRKSGVDCDCYTVFIGSILVNLGIPVVNRVTAYTGTWQHIYPIVPVSGQSLPENPKRSDYIVIDCVKDRFDDEQTFSKNKDFPMDIQQLNGIHDLSGTPDDYILSGMGRLHRRKGKMVDPKPVDPKNPVPNPDSTLVPASTLPAKEFAPATLQVPTVTKNTGVLKNGNRVDLGDIINSNPDAPGWDENAPFRNPYSGSQQGLVQFNRKYLVNGVWDGVSSLSRFIVRDGQVWGVKARGSMYADYGNGQGLKRLPGGRISNPGIPLGELENGLNAMYSISNGQLIRNGSLEGVSRPGVFIAYDDFLKSWQARASKISPATNGLGALSALLGTEVLSALENELSGLGDFELMGFDDISGLNALGDVEISGFDLVGVGGLQGLGNYMADNTAGTSVLAFDGLGRAYKARINRKSKTANNTPAAPVATVNKLGFYVPFNTLRQIFKLRAHEYARLKENGHNVSPGDIPLTLDGLGTVGSFFSKLVNRVADVSSKITNVAKPFAQFIPIPGVAQALNLHSMLVDNLRDSTADNNGGGGQPGSGAQIINPQTPAPPAPAPAPDYVAKYADEAKQAYNESVQTNGLGSLGTLDTVTNFASNNPVLTGGLVLGAGLLAWEFLWPKGKTRKGTGGLNGTKHKAKSKGNGETKHKETHHKKGAKGKATVHKYVHLK